MRSRFLKSLCNLFTKSTASDPVESTIADARYAEHEAGWILEKGGRVLAKLSFVDIDPPFYLFHFELEPDSEAVQLLTRSASREPDETVVFRNQAQPNMIAPSALFFTNVEASGLVCVRDMRPISKEAFRFHVDDTWELADHGIYYLIGYLEEGDVISGAEIVVEGFPDRKIFIESPLANEGLGPPWTKKITLSVRKPAFNLSELKGAVLRSKQ